MAKGFGMAAPESKNFRVAALVWCAFLVGFQLGYSIQNGLVSQKCRVLLTDETNPEPDLEHSKKYEEEGLWRSIEIFQGKKKEPVWTSDPSEAKNDPQKQSVPPFGYLGQAKQDGVVSKLFNFKTGGYFVDLAANLAIQSSNTYMLESKLKWTGLCIDAHPSYWEDLARMRTCKVVAAAVGQTRMEQIPFTVGGGGMGGLVGKDFNNKNVNKAKQTMMYTIPLHDLLQHVDAPRRINYMSLDVEGAELFIMKGFNFNQYIFELISVERPPLELVQLLYKNGYRFLKCMIWFGDILFAHQSVLPWINLTSVGITESTQQIEERDHMNFDTNWTRLAQQGVCRQVENKYFQ